MEPKDLNYYLSLPYSFEIIPEPEGGWVIQVKELPHCIAYVENWNDMEAEVKRAMAGWITTALRNNIPVPEPEPILS